MKMTRRVLALLLALCLTFGNVMPAMATGLEGEETVVTEETTPVVPEVEETEAPAEAEETEAPVAEVTEAPAEVEETEAPVVETEAPVVEEVEQIVDEAANATSGITLSFASTAQRTVFTTSQQVWAQNGITVTNNKGSSTSSVADYSNPARFYKNSELIIAYPGMTKIEFTANSSTYATSLKTSLVAAGYSATVSGSVVTMTLSGEDEISFTLSDGQVRMNSLTVYADDGSCNHSYGAVVTDPTCTADGYTTYTCSLCGNSYTEAGESATGHTKGEDGVCTVCGDGAVLSVAEAITLGESQAHNTYTDIKYCVTGEISEVYDASYGNMYITDGNGNTLTIYGTYDADGSTKYSSMDVKPVAGDTITVYGIVGQYSGTAQIKNGWIVAHTPAEGGDSGDDSGDTGDIEIVVEDGTYVISYGDYALAALDSSKTYGYAPADSATNYSALAAMTIKNVDGGITIQDCYGRYLYMSGTFNSFNVSTTAPTDGSHIWTVSAEGKVVNTVTGKSIQYSSSYGSWGAYTDGENLLTFTTYVEPVDTDPEANSTLTIAEAITLGESKSHNLYTTNKYYVTGKITEVYAPDYGNMYITDGEGNTLTLYGTYSADGSTKYSEMETKPVAGDTITVYGIIGQYSGTAQMKNGWIVEHVVPVNFAFDNSGTNWDKVDGYVADEDGNGYRIDLVKTEGDVYYFSPDEYFPLTVDEIKTIGFCEYSGGGYTNIIAYENGKTYSASDFTITDDFITIYWDNSEAQYEVVNVEYGCEHGGYEGPMDGHFGGLGGHRAKSIEGDIYTIELPACVEGCVFWINNEEYVAVDGMIYPQGTLPMNFAFDNTETKWRDVKVVLETEDCTYYREGMADGNTIVFKDETMDVADVKKIAFFEKGGAGLTNVVDFVNGKTYSADDFTITDEAVTIYWDNSTDQFEKISIELESDCEDHYFIAWVDPTSVEGEISTYEIPACATKLWVDGYDDPFDIVDGLIYPQCIGKPGHETNPISVNFIEMDEEYNPVLVPVEVTVPANTTYYYQASRVSGMVLSINGKAQEDLLGGDMWNPAVFSVKNETKEEAKYVLTVSYLIGDQMNPEQLYLGNQNTSVAEGDMDGYFYTYIAEADGTLNISFAEDVVEGTADIVANNKNTYAQRSLLADGVDGVLSIEVSADDVLEISVAAIPDMNWNRPALELDWTINYTVGHEKNPELIMFNEDGFLNVTVPANTTYYYQAYGLAGMVVEIETMVAVEEEWSELQIVDSILVPDNILNQAYVFTVTNDTAEAKQFNLYATYPAGHQMNPDSLYLGENIATVPADSWTGYVYTWTAPDAGELTIDVSNGKAGWAYSITNMTTYAQTDLHCSYDVPAVNAETITVSAGDEIMIMVNTAGASKDVITPAGDVHFTATFDATVGTEGNPELVFFDEEGKATVTVPANTTYWFQSYGIGGAMLSINGEETIELPIGFYPNMPITFPVTNETEETAEFELAVSYEVGTSMNPAELVVGENVAAIEEGNDQGYYFTYTAPQTGLLTIEFSAQPGWSYQITNRTTGVTGEIQWNDSYPVVNPAIVDVTEGDEIQIIVNAYDPEDTWSYPGGNVTLSVSMGDYPEGSEKNPIEVIFDYDEDGPYATVEVPANGTYYFQAYGIGGMDLYVNGEYAAELPAGDPRMPVVFTLTNDADEPVEYFLSAYFPMGSYMNPDPLMYDFYGTYEHFEQGDEDGRYYTYTARKTGTLEFKTNAYLGAAEIVIDVVDPETYVSAQYSMSADAKKGVLSVPVTEGDELMIHVMALADAEGNVPETEFDWYYGYKEGKEPNPSLMKVGKNSVKIAAGDADGHYYGFIAEQSGFVTITMTSKNWKYRVGNLTFDENDNINCELGEYETAKSVTIPVDAGDIIALNVTTANGKAGTISFTVAYKSTEVDLLSGKSATLTFTDPATGKAIKAANANWEITDVMIGEESVEAEAFAEYATLANGKITAAAGLTEEVTVYALATLKTDETDETVKPVVNEYVITIRPAAESITFTASYDEGESEWFPNPGHEDEEPIWDEEAGEWANGSYQWVEEWVDYEKATEYNFIINGNASDLRAVIGPDAAKQEVTWKSSNTKILKVYSEIHHDEETGEEYQITWLEPVFNAKTGKYATGTVTLTATAADGSGTKATIKVNVSLNADNLELSTKNDQHTLASGKSLTITATPKGSYRSWFDGQYFEDVAISGKTVEWSMLMWDEVWVPDANSDYEETFVDENGEEYTEKGHWESSWVEVPASVATLSEKGVLKAGKVTDRLYDIEVTAKVTNADGSTSQNSILVSLLPAAKSVAIDINEGPYDVNSSEEFYIGAYTQVKIPDVEELIPAAPVDLWTTSNAQIVELVELDDPYYEYDTDEEDNVVGIHVYTHKLVFNGKTGKVTLTAHANDGSGAKKSVTINVVKAPSAVEITSGVDVLTAGKSATFKAAPYVEVYNPDIYMSEADYAVSNKGVNWSVKVVEYNDDIWEYEEVDNTIGAKISSKGVLSTNAKLVKEVYTLAVTATAKMTGLYGEPVSYTTYVTVYPATTKVTLYRFGQPVSGTVTIDNDDVVVLHAVGDYRDDYTWKSSNTKIATIEYNPDGSVSVHPVDGGKLGKVTITATANDGTKKSAKVTVNVVKKVDELTIADKVGVAAGKSINLNSFLTISNSDASNKKVTWSWADDAVAKLAKDNKITLSASGTLSAAKAKVNAELLNKLSVKVTAADGFGASDEAVVNLYPATTKVEIYCASGESTPDKLDVNDKSLKIGVLTTPDGALGEYTWTSSNTKIATVEVDEKGICSVIPTGTKLGKVTITAKAMDGSGKSAKVTIQVLNAIQKVSVSDDYLLSVGKGKTVTMSKYVTVAPENATIKTMKWSMELVEWNEETGEYVTKDDGIVPKTMATLDTKTGALKCVKVTDYEFVKVTFTAQDGYGASGSMIVILAPAAVKGLKVLAADFAEEFVYEDLVNYTKKTYKTTSDAVMLYPEVTNDGDKIASDLIFTLSNKNFQVEWEKTTEVDEDENGVTRYIECLNPVVRPVEGAENPYGKVKVTMKTTDGSNVSTYVTINFVEPTTAPTT